MMNENEGVSEFTIEKAQDVLNRIIGFVGNCDQKAGLLIAASGLFITFFIQERIICALISNSNRIEELYPCLNYLYKFCLLIGIIIFLYGEYALLRVLRANINNSSVIKSVIF